VLHIISFFPLRLGRLASKRLPLLLEPSSSKSSPTSPRRGFPLGPSFNPPSTSDSTPTRRARSSSSTSSRLGKSISLSSRRKWGSRRRRSRSVRLLRDCDSVVARSSEHLKRKRRPNTERSDPSYASRSMLSTPTSLASGGSKRSPSAPSRSSPGRLCPSRALRFRFPFFLSVGTADQTFLPWSIRLSWRGVRDDALSKLIDVPGCIFCHAAGFIGVRLILPCDHR
jgi:hypothetical protein